MRNDGNTSLYLHAIVVVYMYLNAIVAFYNQPLITQIFFDFLSLRGLAQSNKGAAGLGGGKSLAGCY